MIWQINHTPVLLNTVAAESQGKARSSRTKLKLYEARNTPNRFDIDFHLELLCKRSGPGRLTQSFGDRREAGCAGWCVVTVRGPVNGVGRRLCNGRPVRHRSLDIQWNTSSSLSLDQGPMDGQLVRRSEC